MTEATVRSVRVSNVVEGESVTFCVTLTAGTDATTMIYKAFATSPKDGRIASFSDGITADRQGFFTVPAGLASFSLTFATGVDPTYTWAKRKIALGLNFAPAATAIVYDQAVVTRFAGPGARVSPHRPITFDVKVNKTNQTTHIPIRIPKSTVTLTDLKFSNGVAINGRGDMLIVPANVSAFKMRATVKIYGKSPAQHYSLSLGTGVLAKSVMIHFKEPAPTLQMADTQVRQTLEPRSTAVFDRNGDGAIDPKSETVLSPNGMARKTDFASLAAFDSNHDGLIDLKDPQWQRFGVWHDRNGDGMCQKAEFETLERRGVVALDLRAGSLAVDDSLAHGLLPVLLKDGSLATLAVAQRL